jgi:predicted alpha-1,2-mannosidase
MIQWSPDTTPNRVASGGGYAYADSHIAGFSLTHLSGSGCPSYQDIPILPTVGSVGKAPAHDVASFSHSSEVTAPGRYAVTLGPSGIRTQLAVTTRTGISQFTFPHSRQANLLFKVAGSANPVTNSSVSTIGSNGIAGEVTSGQFCGTGTNYNLYFDAVFSRPFASTGSWNKSGVSPGTTSCHGTACGAYVSFNTESSPTVMMKVGISFVSVANAAANLQAEDPGWSLGKVASAATGQWNNLLGRVRIGGGSTAQMRTFYTAMYHSLLFPNVVSDVNGQYAGSDGQVHQSANAQYSNFSEWDIYRSEIELVSMVAPHQAGDMIQSLVDDAEQGGWLPKWAIVAGDASQMNGDSADPIIAAAYAFGVRGFDAQAALAAMVKGATQDETNHGLEIERQYLDQYLTQHYVNAGSLDLTSINYSIGGSVTLEYAIDDYSIAQFARSLGDTTLYDSMMQRAHNWQYLFNPATGYIQARGTDGSFPTGPTFQTSLLEPGGELGFEEGNAVQYTWSVPQDLAALSSLIGGDAQAVKQLNAFFTVLNAGRDKPFDWAGNEPSLWTPWEYDYFAAPSRTQAVVREIADKLYNNTPANEPGNDDLGALSSWYVWAAIGLYPVTPGSANLALASPLFPNISITLGDGHHLVERAPAASASTPYVHSLTITGGPASYSVPSCAAASSGAVSVVAASPTWQRPWVPASILQTGGTLSFDLSSVPDPSWGSNPAAAPPSDGTGRLPVVGFTRPSGGVSIHVGQTANIVLGVQPAEAKTTGVRWSARISNAGLSVAPPGGSFGLVVPRGTSVVSPARTHGCPVAAPATHTVSLRASAPGSYLVDIDLSTLAGAALPPVVISVVAKS